jgi:Kef-type K+ transport system membrane component KefB
MEIIVSLLMLLGISILLGKLAERLGVPDVVGNILAGILLGPMVLGLIQPSATLSGIGEVSLFFITLLIGIEVDTSAISGHVKSALGLSLSSFVLPFIIMFAVFSYLFLFSPENALITSLAISIPSISIVSVLLMEYKLVDSEDGKRILSAVVVSDTAAFLILAFAIGKTSPLTIIFGMAIFFAIFISIDKYLRKYDKKARRTFFRISSFDEDFPFAVIILAGLVVSAILDIIGITYVLGGFFAGILIHETIVGRDLFGTFKRTFRRMNNSFFIPVFFSTAGLLVAYVSMQIFYYVAASVLIAVIAGGAITIYAGKALFDNLKPTAGASILGGRGAVGIIIASLAFSEGAIGQVSYTAILLSTIIISIAMPSMLRLGIAKQRTGRAQADKRMPAKTRR